MMNRVRVESRYFVIFLALVITGPARSAGMSPGLPVQMVSPGQSIQTAIDKAAVNGWIFIQPGIYRETADATNGLNVTASINLVGLSSPSRRVVLENAGGQKNGIVVVPKERTGCMSCHSSLAPPFPLLPGVHAGAATQAPKMSGFSISGVTIRDFDNNGLFTENVDGFSIVDVASINNKNYGIFPTLSANGTILGSSATGSGDTGIWVETSQNVLVTGNVVDNNVVGFEISNSDNVILELNEARNNSIGVGAFILPGLFAEHAGAKHITIRNNSIHDNNRVNDGESGSLLGALPSGTGILEFGVDYSVITENRIANNNLTGVAIVDVCLGFAGTQFDCSTNANATPAFLADQDATNNRITNNILIHNGTNPQPSPFTFAAGDLTLLSFGAGNCFSKNSFATAFSILGSLPPCP